MQNTEVLKSLNGWHHNGERPENGELVVYYFEPFGGLYVGKYDEETDSVHGKAGFTSWCPEVSYWYPIPKCPIEEEELVND